MSTDTAFALGVLGLVGPRWRDAAARVPAHARRVRRPGRAGGDRRRLHRAHLVRRARRSPRRCFGVVAWRSGGCGCGAAEGVPSWSASACGSRCTSRASTRRSPAWPMGLATSAYLPAREDLEERDRARPLVPRAADAGARPLGPARAGVGGLAQRAPAAAAAPVDELRDRPAVRARQRRHHDRLGALLRDAVGSPITLGILLGYVVGKPLGIMRRVLARAPGAACACRRRLGSAAGRRRGRRDRLHRVAADRRPGVRRAEPRGGQARRASARGDRGHCWSAGSSSASSTACPRRCARASSPAAPRTSSTSPTPSTRSATTSAARGRVGDARRVRRLRVPVLRPGRGGRARAARRLGRRPALRVAPPAAQRRPRARPAGGRGGGGRGAPRASSGRCTTSCSPTRSAAAARPRRGTPSELGLDVDRFCDELRRRAYAPARRRGRGERRRERRHRHADVLHQRPPPPRRL